MELYSTNNVRVIRYPYQAPVVQTLDSANSVIDFRNTYPLDRDLSGG